MRSETITGERRDSKTIWTWPRFERRTALWMLVASLMFGVWQGNASLFALRADGDTVQWSRPYFLELTGTLTVLVWSWIPFAAARNAPPAAGRWARFLAVHLTSYVAFTALHTGLMLAARSALYPVLGWGGYPYPAAWLRLAKEWHEDLLAYVVLAVGFGLVSSWRDGQRNARIATELRDAQLRALVGQLNPHFLFNALNTISAVMYIDLARTDRLLADLGQVLRAGLTGDAGPTWSLAEERSHTEHFLAVMVARFGERLRIRWRFDAAAGAAQVPRFTLQLLVENAIKHNQDARTSLVIAISARRVADRVELEVADNGRGFGLSPVTGTGTGLATLRRALELCHGPETTLDIDRAPDGGARVRLNVPAELTA
jgi:two-component system LytT family sensor kinase